MASPPKAVIFDLDGCLVDSEPLVIAAISQQIRRMGIADISADEISARFLGVSMQVICRQLAKRSDVVSERDFVAKVEAQLLVQYRTQLRRIDGVMALLEALRTRGVPVAIATGGSIFRMTATLNSSALSGYFDGVAFSADQVAQGKPAPDLFLFAAQQLGVAPTDCVVLEDSPHGVKGAVAAGMRAIGFVGGSHLDNRRDSHTRELESAGAGAVFSRLSEVKKHLLSRADQGKT